MKRLLTASIVASAFAHGAAAQEIAPFEMDVHDHLAAADEARIEADRARAQADAARAQADGARAQADVARVQADAWKRWADDFSREMRTSMGSLFAGRVVSHKLVKGAPYSARIVTEMNQPLADGNVISHKHEGAVYRDSEGRTRQETLADGARHASVMIDDPVEHKRYMLTPDSKRAIETTARVRESRNVVIVDGKKMSIEDGKVTVDGKEVADNTVVVKSKNGKEVRVENGRVTIDGKDVADITSDAQRHVVVKTINSPSGTREEVRVQVVRPGEGFDIAPPTPPTPPTPPRTGFAPPAPPTPPTPPRAALAPLPPMPPLPPIPGVETMRFENVGRLGKGVTTNLGAKNFDGVHAEGKQVTWTIPAGEIGNRAPINVVSESWYSPELQVTVYSRYSDPRTGESIYRLTGIKRGEPPADLFRVPADYKLKSRNR